MTQRTYLLLPAPTMECIDTVWRSRPGYSYSESRKSPHYQQVISPRVAPALRRRVPRRPRLAARSTAAVERPGAKDAGMDRQVVRVTWSARVTVKD